ncbi:MAG TPA: hypothetical protein VNM46_10910, partial [Xanthobacteraceae bacterium]|nr:hypothetical protein [Xanthobacteraceae bacterium]
MTFQRHQRRIVGYAIATAVAFAAPAYAKPEDKAKPAASTAAKPDDKSKSAKPAATKPAKPAAKKDEKAAKAKKSSPVKTAAKKSAVPLPRARPVLVASTVPMVPAKATLSPL